MPVRDRRYHGFEGERRSGGRAVVLARFGIAAVFESRFALLLFLAAWVPFLAFATILYVRGNLDLFSSMGIRVGESFPQIGATLFFWSLGIEAGVALVFAAFVGPSLVAPDLAHGALPLYFSRPVSRMDYVLGKGAILAALLSAITWLPGVLLWGLQFALAGHAWAAANLRALGATVAGGLAWVAVVTLLALATSAWVRWRPLATAALFVVFLAGSAAARIVSVLLATRWGDLLSVQALLLSVWGALFGVHPVGMTFALPGLAAGAALALLAAAALLLLRRKLAPFEVER